jgi:hypothetical protein
MRAASRARYAGGSCGRGSMELALRSLALLAVALCAAVLAASVVRADASQSTSSSSSPASGDDSDLIEFLGSVGAEDEEWLTYLAQTDPTKVAKAPQEPPASSAGKHDE